MKNKIIAVFLTICCLSACNQADTLEKNIPVPEESVVSVSFETSADAGQIEDPSSCFGDA